jgi:cytochrome oxidase Cu insertion factor (SCO1/SenC/PrrC family)
VRRRWSAISVAAAAIVGIAVGVALHGRLAGTARAEPALQGQATWQPGVRPAPPFALTDQRGGRVTLASLHARAVVVTFMDSLCTSECPIEGHLLAASVAQAGAAARPRIVIVSVDPPGDTPATTVKAMRKWGLPAGTLWLRGTHAQLKRVWDAYKIGVAPTTHDVAHSTALYLIDRDDDERAGFLVPFVPAAVSADLELLSR